MERVGGTKCGDDKCYRKVQSLRNDKVIVSCMDEEVGLEEGLRRNTTSSILSTMCRCTISSGNLAKKYNSLNDLEYKT